MLFVELRIDGELRCDVGVEPRYDVGVEPRYDVGVEPRCEVTLDIFAGDGFASLVVELVCCATFDVTATGVGATGVCTVLLNSAFDMATTGENSLRLISLQREKECHPSVCRFLSHLTRLPTKNFALVLLHFH